MKENKNRVLAIGTITYAIGNLGTKIINFLIVPLYTYYINPSDMGDYDLLVTTVSLLSPLLTLKISEATYRWIINKKENEVVYISATYKLLLRNCLLAACVLIVINHFLPIWHCYLFIAILVGDRVLECLQKLLRGLKNQLLFAISGLIHTIIFVGLNVYKICYKGEGVTALLESSVASLYFTIIVILVAEKRLRTVRLGENYSVQTKEMIKYSAPLVPSALSWWVMSASDRYLIRFFIGKTANGIYAIAYKFPSFLQTVFIMFNNAWTDMALAELNKDENSEEYAQKVFEQMYKFSFGIVCVLIPLTKIAMILFLSDAYADSAIYVGFLYLGTIFQGFSSFCSIGYLNEKKTVGAAKTSIYGAFINLIINLLLINFIGLFAAAISTFLGFFVMWLLRMRDIRNIFYIKIDLRKFIFLFLLSIVIACASVWTSINVDVCIASVSTILFFFINKEIVKKICNSLLYKMRGHKDV